jgi:signal transduction histidine kinase
MMEIQARLVRGFSHDVKNPLGAALGYAAILEEGIVDTAPKRAQSLHRMSASIRSALSLIDHLVEYAKTKMAKVEIRPGPTDVAELVEEIAEEYRGQIEAAGLVLLVGRAPTLPIIESDRIRIREILGNLLSNAVKYSVRGSIELRCELGAPAAAPPDSEWIAVHVADTGPGIAEADQALVFEEFARLDPSATQGTGLGLPISQWIANALGARISLESRVGHGSTFTLWLPTQPSPILSRTPDAA